jgi:hypothetical protein
MDMQGQRAIPVDILAVLVRKDQKEMLEDIQAVGEIPDM